MIRTPAGKSHGFVQMYLVRARKYCVRSGKNQTREVNQLAYQVWLKLEEPGLEPMRSDSEPVLRSSWQHSFIQPHSWVKL